MEIKPLVISTDPAMVRESGQFSGGPRIRAVEYAKHMEKMVYIVLTMGDRGGKNVVASNVHAFPVSAGNRISQFASAYREGCRLIEGHGLNIIDAQEPWYAGVLAYMLARKYHLPFCIGLYGDDLDNPVWLSDSTRNRIFNVIGKYVAKRSDSLHVSSTAIKERMKRIGIDERRIDVFPVYIEPSRFEDIRGDKELLGVPPGVPVVLSVGRLDRLKNFGMLIRAAKIVTSKCDAMFVIVGTGPEEQNLARLAKELGVERKVVFLGSVEYSKMPEVFVSSDVFVLTSNLEGRSMAAVEAMLSGLPIILTDISGAKDIVSEGHNGYLVEMNDQEKLAERICELLRDGEKRRVMGQRGREFALDTQTLSKNAFRMAKHYENAILLHKRAGEAT